MELENIQVISGGSLPVSLSRYGKGVLVNKCNPVLIYSSDMSYIPIHLTQRLLIPITYSSLDKHIVCVSSDIEVVSLEMNPPYKLISTELYSFTSPVRRIAYLPHLDSLILIENSTPNKLHRWDLSSNSLKASYNLDPDDNILLLTSLEDEIYLGGSHKDKGVATILRVKEDDLEIVWRGLFPHKVHGITRVDSTLVVASDATVISI